VFEVVPAPRRLQPYKSPHHLSMFVDDLLPLVLALSKFSAAQDGTTLLPDEFSDAFPLSSLLLSLLASLPLLLFAL